jgi:D-threonate/D-erythronate kinase
VLVFTTETRGLSAERAGELVAHRATKLNPILNKALLFKKVDSVARGNFAAEIIATLHASGAVLALVAPAFPEAGRTVDNGVLKVRDWSGQDAAIPLRELFPREKTEAIGVLPAGSEECLQQEIADALTKGVRILLCDATTQIDLDRLAAAGLNVHRPLLWAGSAGLAYALAGKVPAPRERAATETAKRRGRTLLFAGTDHAVTSLQIAHLQQEPGGMNRPVHRPPYISTESIVATFATEPVGGLILTGGDTASFVLRALQASNIELAGEVARGIPWGFVEGGLADGCVVVTKSGGFGERDALVRAFEFCERRFCDPA